MAHKYNIINIEEEFKKNDQLCREDLETLRRWIKDNIQNSPCTDIEIYLFLHRSNYNMEKAKRVATCYCNTRKGWPQVFKNRNPNNPIIKKDLNSCLVWHLKNVTGDGFEVSLIKTLDWDPNNYIFEDQLKIYFMVLDYWVNRIGNRKGLVVILDVGGLTWAHLPKFDIKSLHTLLEFIKVGFPTRLKSVHFLNNNIVMEKLFAIFKMFIKKDLNKFHFHSNIESLYEYVPKYCLPKDYGGLNDTIEKLHEEMVTSLSEDAEFFAKDDQEEILEYREKFTYLEID